MNIININDMFTVKTQLETLYLDYATRFGRSIAPTVPTGTLQVYKGTRKAIWSIMRKSHESNSSSSGGSSYNFNELTMYRGSDPVPISDNEENVFDLLAWWK